MKKPTLMELPSHEELPKNVYRADLLPKEGFVIEIDGRMKKQFDSNAAAEKEAIELKTRFPMIEVKIYDAVEKTRTLISAPEADAS